MRRVQRRQSASIQSGLRSRLRLLELRETVAIKSNYFREKRVFMSVCTTRADGTKAWWLRGKLHREDGPAVEYSNGDKEWRLNGQLHRADGPAIEMENGSKFWFLHGLRHREDGPAQMYIHGSKYWYGISWWFIRGTRLDGNALVHHQQSLLSRIIIGAFLPLDLPPYVLLSILQFAYPFICDLNERHVVRFLQGDRISALEIKKE